MAFDITLREYLKEIDEADLLSWEEEKDLAGRIIDYQDPEARDRLVRSNLRLVVNIAKTFSGRHLTLGDLVEEGNLGLLRAVDSFDPEHGVRFSTYAAWWIKQSIKRALLLHSQPIHVPTYMVELVNQYRHTVGELESRLGRSPKIKEVAEEMKLTVKKTRAVEEIVRSVDAGFQGENAADAADLDGVLFDDENGSPEDLLADTEDMNKAVDLLEEIDSREAQILRMRFGLDGQEPLTLKQIGKEMDLTRERVRQLQRSALTRLNELMTA